MMGEGGHDDVKEANKNLQYVLITDSVDFRKRSCLSVKKDTNKRKTAEITNCLPSEG